MLIYWNYHIKLRKKSNTINYLVFHRCSASSAMASRTRSGVTPDCLTRSSPYLSVLTNFPFIPSFERHIHLSGYHPQSWPFFRTDPNILQSQIKELWRGFTYQLRFFFQSHTQGQPQMALLITQGPRNSASIYPVRGPTYPLHPILVREPYCDANR